jgi:tetratricopeptide (TPR) repeat protein
MLPLLRRRRLLAGLALLLLAPLAVLAARHARDRRLLRAAEQALAERDFDAAREGLRRYLDSHPDDPHARLLAARAARRLRRYDEAAEHLRACHRLGADPDAVDLEWALADVQRGDGATAAALRARAAKGDKDSLEILEVLIQHYLDGYRLPEVLACLNLYLERRPGDLKALLGRAYVWERLLYFPDALKDYRRAVELHPDSEAARLRLAKTELIAGTPAEALWHFEWLAGRHPGRPEVVLGLARCRRRLGQPEEARRLLDELLAGHPEDVEALAERGQLALDEDDLARAERWLRAAVRLAPHDQRANYSLYRCLSLRGKEEEAKTYRARADRLRADLKRLDEVSKAVMASPDDAALRCEGGILFLRNGEEQEGLRWLNLALRLDPNCTKARRALEDYYRDARRRAPRP